MKSQSQQPHINPPGTDKRQPYEKPAILFTCVVTTRAGSPLHTPHEQFDTLDLLKLLRP